MIMQYSQLRKWLQVTRHF